jgi:hypothetical protein
MHAPRPEPPAEPEERRIVLERVPWATYVHLRDALEQNAAEMEASGLSSRLELSLGPFVVAALVLLVIARVAS